MDAAVRPTPWRPPPEGFHFEAVDQQTAGWTYIGESDGRGCRWGAGPGKPACGAPAVATFMRSNGPWAYCAEHLYGRWIEDEKVMGWRLVKDDS